MAYAAVADLLRLMHVQNATAEKTADAERALEAAAWEIDSYLGWDELETPPTLTDKQLALVETVNLDRAGEHLRLTPYGVLGQFAETPPTLTARDSWYRHARKLASLKTSWGIS